MGIYPTFLNAFRPLGFQMFIVQYTMFTPLFISLIIDLIIQSATGLRRRCNTLLYNFNLVVNPWSNTPATSETRGVQQCTHAEF